MPSWSELRHQLDSPSNKTSVYDQLLFQYLQEVSKKRKHKNVIIYASAFLQKPTASSFMTQISLEDINGFMNAIKGMKCEKGLVLVLHTPGGDINAVKAIVDYLHQKFEEIEVIVPCIAMSGGSMIALASDKIVMGKPSILGPIDPQLSSGAESFSARYIKKTFEEAKKDIEGNINLALLWAPILQNLGPSLLLETAKEALSYSEELAEGWLKTRQLLSEKTNKEKEAKAKKIAKYFNADDNTKPIRHHGQSIAGPDLENLGIPVEYLETDQKLQESVMTLYHVMTIIFERSPGLKFIAANGDGQPMWMKSAPTPASR